MSVRSSLGTGRYVGSEDDVYAASTPAWAGGAIGVVYCHGANGTAKSTRDYTAAPGELALIEALAAAGFAVVTADLGGPLTFANDTAITRVGQARTYLQGTRSAAAGKVLLVGSSMGAALALAYARANPTHVYAVAGVLPLLDLNDFVLNNRSGMAASVHTAYGSRAATCGTTNGSPTVTCSSVVAGDDQKQVSGPGIPVGARIGDVAPGVSFALFSETFSSINATATNLSVSLTIGGYYQATHGATKNPVTFASSLAMPVGLWTASDDAVCVPSTADAFVTARPATTRTNLGAVGHTQAAISASVAGVVTFCQANSA